MSSRSPSWEVVDLVANRLDGKTLAVTSCVCNSWSIITSPELLWENLCTTHYPSLCDLKLSDPAVTYRRLYAMGYSASIRRVKPLPKPTLMLENLVFIIDVYSKRSNCHIIKILKSCKDLELEKDLFRFNIQATTPVNIPANISASNPVNIMSNTPANIPATTTASGENLAVGEAVMGEVKITWSVVMEGCKGVFNMMDCAGKLSLSGGPEGCFSEELSSPGCCGGGVSSGIVADLKMVFGKKRDHSGKFKIEKVSVGMLSVVSWRYLSVDDGLRYLQHFLLRQ